MFVVEGGRSFQEEFYNIKVGSRRLTRQLRIVVELRHHLLHLRELFLQIDVEVLRCWGSHFDFGESVEFLILFF